METRQWRLFVDGPVHAARNMALDEALLRVADRHPETFQPTLRFYQWEPAAVTIGYGQRYTDFEVQEFRNQGYDFVRRPTGGGALFHSREITFSFVASVASGEAPRDLEQVYTKINRGLIAGLAELGIQAEQRGCPDGGAQTSQAAFCNYRLAASDVVVDGAKLIGAAQRWTKRAVLEHGFVPLEPNPMTPEVLSLHQLLGRPVAPDMAVRALRRGFETALGIRLVTDTLTLEESKRADELTLQYSADEWNRRR